jgi:hypothetical protein
MAFIELHSIICGYGLALLGEATIFLIGLCNEERECRSPRGDASIGTLCSRGNGHCADREFNFSDLALIALALLAGSHEQREVTKDGERYG